MDEQRSQSFLDALALSRTGLSWEVACNVVARLAGLKVSERSPWTTDEIDHIRAMRKEREAGRWQPGRRR